MAAEQQPAEVDSAAEQGPPPPGPAVAPSGMAYEFPELGVAIEVFEQLLRDYPHIVAQRLRTTDVCHTLIKLLTCPDGWTLTWTVTDAAKGWYSHKYTNDATG